MHAYFRCLRPLRRLRVIIGLVLRVSAVTWTPGWRHVMCPLNDEGTSTHLRSREFSCNYLSS
jgi:hypothetical protein